MITARLLRFAGNPRQTLGRIYVGDKSWLTIERSKIDMNHPCIPAGTYPLKLGMYYSGDGPGGKEDYPAYEVLNVPGRSEIKIHGANKASQLLGCIALGHTHEIFDGEIGITSSRGSLAEFMAELAKDPEAEIAISEEW